MRVWAQCFARARRPPFRHGHLPLHGRRGLDAVAARSAPRRTRGACRAPPGDPRGLRAPHGVEVDTRGTHSSSPSRPRGSSHGRRGDDGGARTRPDRRPHRTPHRDATSDRRGLRRRRRPLRRPRCRALLMAARSSSRAQLPSVVELRPPRPRRAPTERHRGSGLHPTSLERATSHPSRRSRIRICRGPASSFVGRAEELQQVLSRIEHGARLVTLTGPGGTGKTRLALEAATSLVPEYKAGVFWVGLASLRDPALLTETVSQTLGAKDGLAEHIAERELLLLLDNFEQVIEAAPELSSLLSACPNLDPPRHEPRAPAIQGEVEYAVPPLARPEAVSLFCARVPARPSEEIVELCSRLDSLPLARRARGGTRQGSLAGPDTRAPLAAPRPPERRPRRQIPASRRSERPSNGATTSSTAEEQQLFARLSVFAGGCTLEAAEEVAGQTSIPCRRSSRRASSASPTRATGCSRRSASTHLRGRARHAPAEPDRSLSRHAEHYLQLAEASRRRLRGPDQTMWLQRIVREEGNLRASLEWAVTREQSAVAFLLVHALEVFWIRANRRTEARSMARSRAWSRSSRRSARVGACPRDGRRFRCVDRDQGDAAGREHPGAPRSRRRGGPRLCATGSRVGSQRARPVRGGSERARGSDPTVRATRALGHDAPCRSRLDRARTRQP